MDKQEIEQIETGVMCFLTQRPNEFISIISIYNNYDNDIPVSKLPEKKMFKTICELFDTRHNNIIKTYKNGMCYLCFTLDESKLNDALKKVGLDKPTFYNITESEQTRMDNDFRNIDQCSVIEFWINNPDVSPSFDFTKYFDGENTILHIMAKNGRYDLIERLNNLYGVDFDIRNKHGEHIIDVAKQGDFEFIKKLVNLMLKSDKRRKDEKRSNEESDLKRNNMLLLRKNEESNNNYYKSQNVVKSRNLSIRTLNRSIILLIFYLLVSHLLGMYMYYWNCV